ncbi:MAG: hypothetical protein MUC92_13730 [Fimbriimonadaceae bacterium]|nr:hypothetical protein [Fimbriimonadaceae bacterium]
MFSHYAPETVSVFEEARSFANSLGYSDILPEHLLAAICLSPSSPAGSTLTQVASLEEIYAEVLATLTVADAIFSSDLTVSRRTKRVMDLAFEVMRESGHDQVEPLHLLMALVKAHEGENSAILSHFGVTEEKLSSLP